MRENLDFGSKRFTTISELLEYWHVHLVTLGWHWAWEPKITNYVIFIIIIRCIINIINIIISSSGSSTRCSSTSSLIVIIIMNIILNYFNYYH